MIEIFSVNCFLKSKQGPQINMEAFVYLINPVISNYLLGSWS
jgi:hypothetical protein